VKEEFAGITDILEILTQRGETICVAESLTGGGLAQALTSLPGSSRIFRGSVMAYQVEIKNSVLKVPLELISEMGTVSEEVAVSMAAGVKELMGSTWSISTTGVAGPGPVDGRGKPGARGSAVRARSQVGRPGGRCGEGAEARPVGVDEAAHRQ
jgi:nicotinamide-nucleotide amidase